MNAAQPTLEDWKTERDAALQQVAANAGERFLERAKTFVLRYLSKHAQASGEEITLACKAAGIVPVNTDRAFGAVYRSLSVAGRIEVCGEAIRTRGHGTRGGNLWKLTLTEAMRVLSQPLSPK